MTKYLVVVLNESNEAIESFGTFNSQKQANRWLDEHEHYFDDEEVVIVPHFSCMSVLREFDEQMGKLYPITPEQFTEYVNRILTKTKTKKDMLDMPIVHREIAKELSVVTQDGTTINIEQFKKIIMQRPNELVKQNKKMKASSTDEIEYFNTTLPAVKGIIVDESSPNLDLRVVNTCLSAGECKLKCYARKGNYVQWKNVALDQNRTLNYVFNDPEGFEEQLKREIELKIAENRDKKVQIRWNDSGDLLSQKFFDMVMRVVQQTKQADHYIYTKEVKMVKSSMDRIKSEQDPHGWHPAAKKNDPLENIIMNYSFGGHQDASIDPKKDKHSRIFDFKKSRPIKKKKKAPIGTVEELDSQIYNKIVGQKKIQANKIPVLNRKGEQKVKNGKLVFETEWVYNDAEGVKDIVADYYNLDRKSMLTIDELMKTPKGEPGQYNVMVLPGEADHAASRRDVMATILFIH